MELARYRRAVQRRASYFSKDGKRKCTETPFFRNILFIPQKKTFLTKREYFKGFSALSKRELIEWIVVRYPIIVEITSKYSANENVFKKALKKTISNDEFKTIFEICKSNTNSDAELQEHAEQFSNAVVDLVATLDGTDQPSSLTRKPSSDLTKEKGTNTAEVNWGTYVRRTPDGERITIEVDDAGAISEKKARHSAP